MAEAARPPTRSSALDEVRERFRAAEVAEPSGDRARYLEALKAFLATVERHSEAIQPEASTVAPLLDEAAMALYRASSPELAERAVDLGLKLSPGQSSLLHHKALVLLALNRDLPGVVKLVDQALEANPHDKGLWATRGDALRLQGETERAAEAYLKAQELDPSSSQYVDRALRLAPGEPRALRMKVEIARARGGDASALEAVDELLKTASSDRELLRFRAELLAALGRKDESLAAVRDYRATGADDLASRALEARLLLELGRTEEASTIARALLEPAANADAPTLEAIARAAGPSLPEVALAARERLREVDSRNVQNLLDLKELAGKLGRPEPALAACRAVLVLAPENLEAMRGIAELQVATGHPSDALESYRTIARTHPHAVGEFRKALDLARQTSLPEAVREFAEAILLVEPKDADARLELARGLAAAGDIDGALAEFDALLEAHPGQLPYLLEKRALLSSSGDAAARQKVLEEIFTLDPTRTDVAIERGNLCLAQAYELPERSAEREAAARAALGAYERASTDPEAASVSLLGVARASRLIDDPERALKAYADFLALEGNAERLDVRKERAHTLRELGRYAEAAEEYKAAIVGGLEDHDLFWGAAEVYERLNQEALALRYLELLVRRDPTHPLYLRRKAQLLLRTGRREEALKTLQQVVAGAPADPHPYFEAAEVLRLQGAYADAIDYLRRGLHLDPKNRHGQLALAEILLHAGQYPEVVTIIDPLLKDDPNDLAAWRSRADAYRALGRPQEVLYSLQAILLLEPDNGPALLETYRLRHEANERKEAYEALTRLVRSNAAEAQDATLHLERGDLASALGLPEEANTAYERAAQLDPALALEISLRRARLRLSAGRPDLALEVLDAGQKGQPAASPPSVASLLLRAEILVALERPADARTVFEKVRTLEPKSPVALAGIAQAMIAEGRSAEAAEFVRGLLREVPPSENFYLLLAEAESGVGELDRATSAVKDGTKLLPRSIPLWSRLGEIAVARQDWTEASGAFAHALSLAPTSPELLLRAAFVAERLGHPNEAVALYDHATETVPTNRQAWTSRGLALVAAGRHADALASFDRALSLDSDYLPAKEGRKLAQQRTRDAELQRHGRDALLLEARLHRPVTKNDLFVLLHVPFELLEPVLQEIARPPKVDLDRLEGPELHDLENASYHLITAALDRRPAGIERRGLTLADVAVLAPGSYTLSQIQRLFGYLKTVLEAELKADKIPVTPDVEDLTRKAFHLPPEGRTLFQLVRTLRVGVYKARLIKTLEEAGASGHRPLPTLDLGAYSPEFRDPEASTPRRPPTDRPTAPSAPATTAPRPPASPAAGSAPASAEPPHPKHEPPSKQVLSAPAASRCLGCGGIATATHSCGAPLCQRCANHFPKCPKCGEVVVGRVHPGHAMGASGPSTQASAPAPRSAPAPAPRKVPRTGGRGDPPSPAAATAPQRKEPEPRTPAVHAAERPAVPAGRSASSPSPPPTAGPPAPPRTEPAGAGTEAGAAAPPAKPRPKRDDEPRL